MAETVMGMSVFCTGVCEDKELTELMWDVNTDLNFWPWLKRFCQVEDTWEAPCMHHECVSCTFWMHTCMLSCLDSWHMAWGLWKELFPPPPRPSQLNEAGKQLRQHPTDNLICSSSVFLGSLRERNEQSRKRYRQNEMESLKEKEIKWLMTLQNHLLE